MQYMLLIYSDEKFYERATKEQIGEGVGASHAYTEAMQKAGAMVGGDRLRPASTATTVSVVDGKTKVLDGPYAETKEQLGGYYLIEAADMDAALAWAARCPGAQRGHVEVRPVYVM